MAPSLSVCYTRCSRPPQRCRPRTNGRLPRRSLIAGAGSFAPGLAWSILVDEVAGMLRVPATGGTGTAVTRPGHGGWLS
jgi:hypothetical protein